MAHTKFVNLEFLDQVDAMKNYVSSCIKNLLEKIGWLGKVQFDFDATKVSGQPSPYGDSYRFTMECYVLDPSKIHFPNQVNIVAACSEVDGYAMHLCKDQSELIHNTIDRMVWEIVSETLKRCGTDYDTEANKFHEAIDKATREWPKNIPYQTQEINYQKLYEDQKQWERMRREAIRAKRKQQAPWSS